MSESSKLNSEVVFLVSVIEKCTFRLVHLPLKYVDAVRSHYDFTPGGFTAAFQFRDISETVSDYWQSFTNPAYINTCAILESTQQAQTSTKAEHSMGLQAKMLKLVLSLNGEESRR